MRICSVGRLLQNERCVRLRQLAPRLVSRFSLQLAGRLPFSHSGSDFRRTVLQAKRFTHRSRTVSLSFSCGLRPCPAFSHLRALPAGLVLLHGAYADTKLSKVISDGSNIEVLRNQRRKNPGQGSAATGGRHAVLLSKRRRVCPTRTLQCVRLL
jgi:hypothetical protein